MQKYCEICGKPIRTGRKYCFEHRNTRIEPKNKELDRITKIYIGNKTNLRIGILIFSSIFLIPITLSIYFSYGIIGKIIAILLIIGLIIGIFKVTSEYIDLKNKIANGTDKNYIEFCKNHFNNIQEDKDYKKYLTTPNKLNKWNMI